MIEPTSGDPAVQLLTSIAKQDTTRPRTWHLAWLATACGSGVLLLSTVSGCVADTDADVPGEDQLALTSAAPEPTAFIAGVKYDLIGKARFEATTAQQIADRMEAAASSVEELPDGSRVETFPPVNPAADLRQLSVEQLAQRLRARALNANGYEYIESVPPMERARRVKADLEKGTPPPETPANIMAGMPGSGSEPGRQGRYIIGSDDRARLSCSPSSCGTGYNIALLNGTQVQCSAAMISSKVAATAAHCVWNTGTQSWTIPQSFVPQASNTAPTQPFGTLTWSWIRIPNTGSVAAGWDYAYVEFSDSAGRQYTSGPYTWNLGWIGTGGWTARTTGGIEGYPGDKPNPQLWGAYSSKAVDSGTSTRLKHSLDIVPGNSGGPLFDYDPGYQRLIGIQSTQNRSRTCFAWICGSWTYWNEAERWRTDTYNFFDAGNWPD